MLVSVEDQVKFPRAILKKRKLDVDRIFEALNTYRDEEAAVTTELDERVKNNGMALNSSRHAAQHDAAAAAGIFRLFIDPGEYKDAADAGFVSHLPLTVHKVDTDAAANHLRSTGFVEIPNIQIHKTTTSGSANLPTLSGVYKWDKDARKKYRTDPSGFGQRLNAYYAFRCSEYSSDELSTKTFRALKDIRMWERRSMPRNMRAAMTSLSTMRHAACFIRQPPGLNTNVL